MMKFFCCTIGLWICCTGLFAQDVFVPLYTSEIPCANALEMETEIRNEEIGRFLTKVHQPQLQVFLVPEEQATGTSVLICPGGGYYLLAWDHEGTRMAEWFNSFGVSAFVLQYRLPHWETEACRSSVALADAKQAMRVIRQNANQWNIQPNQVGIMGFSAGGHLASSLSTHFDLGDMRAETDLEKLSARPDFSILMYPVISMDERICHMGSRENLIGKTPSQEQIDFYSTEKQVSKWTPPTLLIHANDDEGVLPENSLVYYQALRQHQVPASLIIYESGGHGFGMASGEKYGAVSQWPGACKAWMEELGLLD